VQRNEKCNGALRAAGTPDPLLLGYSPIADCTVRMVNTGSLDRCATRSLPYPILNSLLRVLVVQIYRNLGSILRSPTLDKHLCLQSRKETGTKNALCGRYGMNHSSVPHTSDTGRGVVQKSSRSFLGSSCSRGPIGTGNRTADGIELSIPFNYQRRFRMASNSSSVYDATTIIGFELPQSRI